MSLDPQALGWHEFWLRIGVIVFCLSLLFLTFLVVGRIVVSLLDLGRWIARRISGEEREEMDEEKLRRTLLGLVPQKSKGRAAGLLQRLLLAREGTQAKVLNEGVYVSEYDGQPSRVHTSAEAAQAACVEHLKAELGDEPRWDWFADDFGWVMRHVDPETNWPGPLLGGRVTKTYVES
ncbi:hypothetical protein SEA_SATIS_235 [Streptomyces phage Satis]|nr:hypothetical protein SEA_SATIS_235 [Streptomyces phage Satis]QBZ72122.1 hypothetical protein SEA_KRADAL_236 [Streptomyces phage Kradal]QPL14543.1 membrane protein [Streptomyces phage EhyElimayoE]